MTVHQSTNAVVMIRPCRFYPNPETASDNAFQREVAEGTTDALSRTAQEEFDRAVEALRSAGVTVHVFEDTPSPEKPDAVFPNNWFSTHQDGRVALYPMYSPARRNERRRDVIDELGKIYRINALVDYSFYRVAYVSLSKRADREPIAKFCTDFNYEPMPFASAGDDGRPIYHTNVVMCIGSKFALVGLELISDSSERAKIRQRLEAGGKKVIELDRNQISNFAGNAIELHNEKENLLVISAPAVAALSNQQREEIERHARLLELSIPTIELAGGSARCMIASVHLPPR